MSYFRITLAPKGPSIFKEKFNINPQQSLDSGHLKVYEPWGQYFLLKWKSNGEKIIHKPKFYNKIVMDNQFLTYSSI